MLVWFVVVAMSKGGDPPNLNQAGIEMFASAIACEAHLTAKFLMNGWQAERKGQDLTVYSVSGNVTNSFTSFSLILPK
jgi:hypothetical protein